MYPRSDMKARKCGDYIYVPIQGPPTRCFFPVIGASVMGSGELLSL